MQRLAVQTARNSEIRICVRQPDADDTVDALLDTLVSQLLTTYREMGRSRLH